VIEFVTVLIGFKRIGGGHEGENIAEVMIPLEGNPDSYLAGSDPFNETVTTALTIFAIRCRVPAHLSPSSVVDLSRCLYLSYLLVEGLIVVDGRD
jgi:hypothetical protein